MNLKGLTPIKKSVCLEGVQNKGMTHREPKHFRRKHFSTTGALLSEIQTNYF
jgi:hypothetical protein